MSCSSAHSRKNARRYSSRPARPRQPFNLQPPFPSQQPILFDFGRYSARACQTPSTYDERGRLLVFQESIRQQQARLEFLHRQERVRRAAQEGNHRDATSTKPTSQLKARPAERVQAAIKIQRAFRAHRTLANLSRIRTHILAASLPSAKPAPGYSYAYSCSPGADSKTRMKYLHTLLAELGALGAALDAAPPAALDQRILSAARRTSECLRHALELAERGEEDGDVWVHAPRTGSCVGNTRLNAISDDCSDADSDVDDLEVRSGSGVVEMEVDGELCGVVELMESPDYHEEEWSEESSSEDSDCTEDGFCSGNEKALAARKAVLASFFSSTNRRWAHHSPSTVNLALRPRRRSSVSTPPSLNAILEDAETEE
ncbi:hypothetical protein EW145_g5822 [Phellinidium pouzarii]|uniref:Uncharacterized protein n=1 Tax=Phellinidium pouzarii TaxID=167371 RepID=A0A4S4KYV9_9AGAM|nr:hypothetical protein EW145_g5822 [Phellinidium pouzarii]